MSKIGQNIKKIRSAKKLNQTQFAELFDLTRGSVGAYEEGRAEPKIETIIHIANYFSLSIDLLLKKEITVNDLFHFDVFHQKLNEAHSFERSLEEETSKSGIELVYIKNQLEYVVSRSKKDFIANLPKIDLPVDFKGTARAFELDGSEMEYNQNGLHHGDILLCGQTSAQKEIKIGQVYVMVHKNGILSRRLKGKTKDIYIMTADDPNYLDDEIIKKDVNEIWRVHGVYSTYLNPPKLIENKVLQLEKRLETLEEKLKS